MWGWYKNARCTTVRKSGWSLQHLERQYIYSSEHKDQNDVKKKSQCEITFYFKAS